MILAGRNPDAVTVLFFHEAPPPGQVGRFALNVANLPFAARYDVVIGQNHGASGQAAIGGRDPGPHGHRLERVLERGSERGEAPPTRGIIHRIGARQRRHCQ